MRRSHNFIFKAMCLFVLIASGTALARAQDFVPNYPGNIDRDFAIEGVKIGMTPQQVIRILRDRHSSVHISRDQCAKERAAQMKTGKSVKGTCITSISGQIRDTGIQINFTEDLPHFGRMIVTFVQAGAQLQTPVDQKAFTRTVFARYPHPSKIERFGDANVEAFWCDRADPSTTPCDSTVPGQLLWMCNGGCSYNWLQLDDNVLISKLNQARDTYLASISTTKVTF